jgi:hypothetical protein
MTRLEIFSRNIFSALKKAKSTHFIYMKLRIIQNISGEFVARDVGIEPTRPFDHRLSRPAPYQAWGIPHAPRTIYFVPYFACIL